MTFQFSLYGQNRDIYVNGTTGNDSTGNGTLGAPFATIPRALQDLPYLITSRIHIRVAAGTYTAWPAYLDHRFGGDGQLTIEGTGSVTEILAEQTTTTAALVGTSGYSGMDLTVSGAGWTADQYYGKFVLMTSGSANGYRFPIFKNTTDTIRVPTNWFGVSSGDKFKIVDPPVSISVNHPIVIRGDKDGRLTAARLGFGNLILETTVTSFADNAALQFLNSTAIVSFSRLKGLDPATDTFLGLGASLLNGVGLFDSAGFDDSITASVWQPALAIEAGTGPSSTVAQGSPAVKIWADTFNFAGLSGAVCRGRIDASSGGVRINMTQSQFGTLGIHEMSSLNMNACAQDLGSLTGFPGVNVKSNSQARVLSTYFEKCDEAFEMESNSSLWVYDCQNASGNLTYGISLGSLCRVIRTDTSTTLGAGGTADIYYFTTAGTASWPASKTNVNDGRGADVVTN